MILNLDVNGPQVALRNARDLGAHGVLLDEANLSKLERCSCGCDLSTLKPLAQGADCQWLALFL